MKKVTFSVVFSDIIEKEPKLSCNILASIILHVGDKAQCKAEVLKIVCFSVFY